MGDDQYAMTPPIGWTAGDSSDNKGNTFAALFNLTDVESTVSVSLNQLDLYRITGKSLMGEGTVS